MYEEGARRTKPPQFYRTVLGAKYVCELNIWKPPCLFHRSCHVWQFHRVWWQRCLTAGNSEWCTELQRVLLVSSRAQLIKGSPRSPVCNVKAASSERVGATSCRWPGGEYPLQWLDYMRVKWGALMANFDVAFWLNIQANNHPHKSDRNSLWNEHLPAHRVSTDTLPGRAKAYSTPCMLPSAGIGLVSQKMRPFISRTLCCRKYT